MLNRIKNEIKLNIYAIKEGIIDIAELTSNKTKRLNLLYKKSQYDKELMKNYVRLGKYFHRRPLEGTNETIDYNIIDNIINDIKNIHLTIELTNKKINELSSDIISAELHEFSREIKRSGLTLRWVKVFDKNENSLKDLLSYDNIKIISISRDNHICLPFDNFKIKYDDKLLLLGRDEDLQQILVRYPGTFKLY